MNREYKLIFMMQPYLNIGLEYTFQEEANNLIPHKLP
jgi:hypothetical protein